jgi:hypothetical protein
MYLRFFIEATKELLPRILVISNPLIILLYYIIVVIVKKKGDNANFLDSSMGIESQALIFQKVSSFGQVLTKL